MVADLRIFARLLRAQVLAKLSYETDFWIGLVAMLLLHASHLTFAWALLEHRPSIAGWTLPEVVLVYGLAVIPRGITELVGDGAWLLPQLVYAGQLERVLLRPMPPVLQVLGQGVGLHGIGSIAVGIVLIVQAHAHLTVTWTAADVALIVVVVCASTVMMTALTLATNSVVLWQAMSGASTDLSMLVVNLTDMSRFPVSLYGRAARLLLTWVIPIALMTYYPALVLLHKPEVHPALAWLAVPIAGAVATGAYVLFSAGLRRYAGGGG